MTTIADQASETRTITVPAGVALAGVMTIPEGARAMVALVQCGGGSYLGRRIAMVADHLQRGGFATILLDLLTPDEESLDSWGGCYRFDVAMLSERLVHATDWLCAHSALRSLPFGYFCASTAAGACLIAAAKRRRQVRALVCCGGRPDLAESEVHHVKAPTLFIVGGADTVVRRLNDAAFARLAAQPKRLDIIPGATHLFEETGALERVAELALDWYDTYLAAGAHQNALNQSL